jgi:RNA polymerase sigma factor for flagellar operon FliA|tara:strand:+ start:1496 stop:2206 length:711 start_codon:yes stop_codon:yes gene_type:complete
MDSNGTGYSPEQNLESQSIDISRKIELVKKIALYLKARIPDYFEADDLIQIGMIGLIEANKNFDPSVGVSFDEYAKRRIKGAILDEVRKASSLSRLAVKNNREYSTAKNSLTNSLGRQATNVEIADYLDVSISELEHKRSHANQFNLVQLDNDLIEADGAFEDYQSNPMLSIEQAELSDRLTNEISKLDDRSKLIISLYYVEELNMKEIGAVIGVNESRVSQLLSATALKLRGSLS